MLFYDALKPKRILPIYSPAMVNFELVDSSMQHVKKFHRIADFKLKNQNNKWVTQNTFENKIYVADFFFTTCPSICPIMTKNMFEVQEKTLKQNVLLVSYSVTPEIDSIAQLKKYALEVQEEMAFSNRPKKRNL